MNSGYHFKWCRQTLLNSLSNILGPGPTHKNLFKEVELYQSIFSRQLGAIGF